MPKASKLRTVTAAVALLASLGGPAFAQDAYGAHERYRDDLDRPYELDGLGLGREEPFLNSEEVGVPRTRRGSLELEGPPISPSLPVLPVLPADGPE